MAAGMTKAPPSSTTTTTTAATRDRSTVSLAAADIEALLSAPGHPNKEFPYGVQLLLVDQPGADAESHFEQVRLWNTRLPTHRVRSTIRGVVKGMSVLRHVFMRSSMFELPRDLIYHEFRCGFEIIITYPSEADFGDMSIQAKVPNVTFDVTVFFGPSTTMDKITQPNYNASVVPDPPERIPLPMYHALALRRQPMTGLTLLDYWRHVKIIQLKLAFPKRLSDLNSFSTGATLKPPASTTTTPPPATPGPSWPFPPN